MAIYLVLTGFRAGSTNLREGDLLDDRQLPVAALIASGCPAVVYDPGTMATPLERWRQGRRQSASLLSLLVASGALGGGGGGGVPTTRAIATTAPLAGGGDLSADRTLSIPAATAASAGHATAAQITKLDGIEAGADVTDAANVAAAGAVLTPGGVQDGDLLVRASGAWARLPAGSDGQLLSVASGAPAYVAAPSAPVRIRGMRIGASGSYYERAAGSNLVGAAGGFEVMVIAILDAVELSGFGIREIVSSIEQFAAPGFYVGVDDTRPQYAMTDGSSARFNLFSGNWARATQGKVLCVLNIGFNGTQRFIMLNGVDIDRRSQTGFTPNNARPWRLGANAATAANPALGMTIVAVGHKQDGVLTAAQREAAFRAFLTTGDLADGVWTSRFSFASVPIGAAPATLADAIGSETLTLVGSDITIVEDGYAGLAETQSPSADATLSTSGGTLTGPLDAPSVSGSGTLSASGRNTVFCRTNIAACTVELPAPTLGRVVRVVDTGNAATNAITINPTGGGQINGAGSLSISTNYGAAELVGDGSNWFATRSAP